MTLSVLLNAQENPPSPPLEEPQKTKSAFFLGFETNFGGATISGNQYGMPYTGANYATLLNRYEQYHFVFDGGINAGYQHYFQQEALGVKEAFGIEVSAYFGMGTPLSDTITYEYSRGAPTNYEVSFLPIKLGFDVNFLWDFWESGEHTLGMLAGIGYRFVYYASLKNSNNASNHWRETYSQSFEGLFLNDFYPQIGLNYYFGSHQFSFVYRFGGMIAPTSQIEKNMFDTVWANALLGESVYFETSITRCDYFSLGYSYRF